MTKEKTATQLLLEALEGMSTLTQYASQIAAHKKAMYDEYLQVGFTKEQALELVKNTIL